MTVHWLLKPPTTLLNITDKLQITSGSKKNLSRESCSTILLIFMFILKMEKRHISVKRFALVGWVWHDTSKIILLNEKFLQFDWLRAVVFQRKLKYLHVKITNLLTVVVQTINSMICT